MALLCTEYLGRYVPITLDIGMNPFKCLLEFSEIYMLDIMFRELSVVLRCSWGGGPLDKKSRRQAEGQPTRLWEGLKSLDPARSGIRWRRRERGRVRCV